MLYQTACPVRSGPTLGFRNRIRCVEYRVYQIIVLLIVIRSTGQAGLSSKITDAGLWAASKQFRSWLQRRNTNSIFCKGVDSIVLISFRIPPVHRTFLKGVVYGMYFYIRDLQCSALDGNQTAIGKYWQNSNVLQLGYQKAHNFRLISKR